MVEVSIEGTTAVFAVQGFFHKLWALRSRLEIPLAHIKDIHADPSLKIGWFHGLKMFGTNVPNFFRAGTYYKDGGWVFWDVRHADKAVVIELQDEKFKRLVVEVRDPEATIALLKETHRDP
jgi:hypothetical protein